MNEFPLVLECRLAQTTEVGVHIQFIGEIVDGLADEAGPWVSGSSVIGYKATEDWSE